jgi:ribosomal protein S18 acetylase RimI-like enzyme
MSTKYSGIIFKIKTASAKEIFTHLKECDYDFVPPLSDKVNLMEYAQKLFKKSITFEAWSNKRIIGLIAAYLSKADDLSVFITNVSVIQEYKRCGIASTLMRNCIFYVLNHNLTTILLQVDKNNIAAIEFYNTFGFVDSKNEDGITLMKLYIDNTII